jgi:hypothetical protein
VSTADDLRRQADQLNAQADQLDANQFGSADLATMNPDEINAARMAGRLDRLLGVPDEQIALTTKARTGRIDADDARALAELGRYDLIEQAHAENRINYPNSESENA